MRKLLSILIVAVCTSNSFAYYQAQQGRWTSRDTDKKPPQPELSISNPNAYLTLRNNLINNYFLPPLLNPRGVSSCKSIIPPSEAGWFTGTWYQSKNTIICNGSGNLIVHENTNYKFGVQDCTRKHEQRHVLDWKNRYGSSVCKGRKKGDLPYFTPQGKPSYTDFLKKSECEAWKIGLKCRKDKLKSCCSDKNPSACKKYVEPYVKQAEAMVKKYCN